MKNLILAMAFVLSVTSFITPAHAQWSVIDHSVLAKTIEQLQQMQKQFDLLKQQYAELQATKNAVTGSYGVSLLENGTEAEEARRILPGTWQDVVSQQSSGSLPGFYGQRQDFYKNLLPAVDLKLFSSNTADRNAVSYKLSTESTQAAFSATEAIYNKIQDRMKSIENLTKAIDQTANVKESTDLNSRIAAENGFLQLDMQRLNSMQLALQANLQNNQNQSNANHAEFFGKALQ